MSMDYVRRYYRVPAKRGGRVKFAGDLATITGSDGARLRIRCDDGARLIVHPTWRMEYLDRS